MALRDLIRKYSVSGPRYTSYPTAPQWTENLSEKDYRSEFGTAFQNDTDPLALYIHIPFCEQLCYYCGCNIQITKDHERSKKYLEALLRELRELSQLFGKKKTLSQISWGGGTPTFLALSEIETLYRGITDHFEVAREAEVSIEIDPRVTSDGQLKLLSELGFNRASLGVQDFNEEVQKVVNRIQSDLMTHKMLNRCHELGFSGVNFDLIYGLPLQTVDSFKETVEAVIQMNPDRIALYNYAHLPSLRPHQKILEKRKMPEAEERVEIFSHAYERLLDSGYDSIGMDHFALKSDEMAVARQDGRLYRNFMGYTVKKGKGLLGVGASSIGESPNSYFQNVREALSYEKRVAETGLATLRGCFLNQDDLERKWIIQKLMCQFKLDEKEFQSEFGKSLTAGYAPELSELAPFFSEGLLEGSPTALRVTDLGRVFVRNIAMIFDAYLKRPHQNATYSRTV